MSLFIQLESGDMVGVASVSVRPRDVVCSIRFTIDDSDAAGGPRSAVLTPAEADELADRLSCAARTVREAQEVH